MGSNVAAEDGTPLPLPEFDRLEQAVRRLLALGVAWRARAEAAESRAQELQATLDGVRTGALDPHQLGQRVAELETENQTLRERLQSAEVLVHRIHARLQFLEEER